MHYLTEDPSYLLIGMGLAVLGCLLALKVTQRGKYLVGAGALALAAAAFFAAERFYVTDAERIEAVVYDLADAIQSSDVDRVKSHLDDRVTLGMAGRTMDGSIALRFVLPMLRQARFDLVRIGHLSTAAGSQTKRGSAEFKVTAVGTIDRGGSTIPIGTIVSEWSLGLTERSPGVWKVNRVTGVKVPREVAVQLFGL